ncbi:unnamed protein product, partial [Mycena citricolor]
MKIHTVVYLWRSRRDGLTAHDLRVSAQVSLSSTRRRAKATTHHVRPRESRIELRMECARAAGEDDRIWAQS